MEMPPRIQPEEYTKNCATPEQAQAEAAGLRWLREGSDRVIEVVGVEGSALRIRRVERVRPNVEDARAAGRELAAIHAQGAPACGAAPEGWEGPNFIGRVEQDCTPTESWGEFYATQRVLPFARAALQQHGALEELKVVEAACERIADTSWDVQPARIHGDLWAGNLLFEDAGPVFIDPAAHGGHPHTDLGMLALFGAPHLREILAGYNEVAPFGTEDDLRVFMHQLHPLAVHSLTHGAAYVPDLVDAARKTLSALG